LFQQTFDPQNFAAPRDPSLKTAEHLQFRPANAFSAPCIPISALENLSRLNQVANRNGTIPFNL
jgi:hypothetical protein